MNPKTGIYNVVFLSHSATCLVNQLDFLKSVFMWFLWSIYTGIGECTDKWKNMYLRRRWYRLFFHSFRKTSSLCQQILQKVLVVALQQERYESVKDIGQLFVKQTIWVPSLPQASHLSYLTKIYANWIYIV